MAVAVTLGLTVALAAGAVAVGRGDVVAVAVDHGRASGLHPVSIASRASKATLDPILFIPVSGLGTCSIRPPRRATA